MVPISRRGFASYIHVWWNEISNPRLHHTLNMTGQRFIDCRAVCLRAFAGLWNVLWEVAHELIYAPDHFCLGREVSTLLTVSKCPQSKLSLCDTLFCLFFSPPLSLSLSRVAALHVLCLLSVTMYCTWHYITDNKLWTLFSWWKKMKQTWKQNSTLNSNKAQVESGHFRSLTLP